MSKGILVCARMLTFGFAVPSVRLLGVAVDTAIFGIDEDLTHVSVAPVSNTDLLGGVTERTVE